MAGTKFSAFTTGATTANTLIVGYDSVAGTNNQYTLAQLAAGLPVATLYGADGTIGTTRKALITDTIQFRNAGDTKDVFNLNTTGAFALGLDAANTSETNVCIGIEAATSSVYGVAIGRKVTMSAPASYATVIGNQAAATGSQSVIVGAYSIAGTYGVTIGASSGGAGDYSLNLGRQATGSAANAVTINASGAAATPSTQYAFGVYMTSETTPDLEVVGGGESTLNTNLKITGQAYTELHDIGTVATATWDIDWNNSNIQSITLNNGGAMTLNTPTNPKTGATYILKLIQGASPSTVTWTASIFKWPAATAPTLSTTTAYVDVITLIYDGTNYLATSTLDLR
jgi:hypothetical protein